MKKASTWLIILIAMIAGIIFAPLRSGAQVSGSTLIFLLPLTFGVIGLFTIKWWLNGIEPWASMWKNSFGEKGTIIYSNIICGILILVGVIGLFGGIPLN